MINAVNMEPVAVCRLVKSVWMIDIMVLIGTDANIARENERLCKVTRIVTANVSVALKTVCPSGSEKGDGETCYLKFENVARELRINLTLTSKVAILVDAGSMFNATRIC